MMSSRTLQIIGVCKGNGFNRKEKILDNIIDYCMAKYYPHNKRNIYDDIYLDKLMKNVFYEYIDNCDKPSAVLNELDILDDIFTKETSYALKVAYVLVNQEVRKPENGLIYVNGFTTDFDDEISKLNDLAHKWYDGGESND